MKKLLIFLMLITTFTTSNSQFIQYPLPVINSNPTYDETVNYLKAIIPHVNSENQDGYERAVERFENYWYTRINQGGKITDYTKLIKDFAVKQSSSSNSNKYSSSWQCMGPFSSQYQVMGRVMAVWVSPNNSDKILIGTRASGIWKSINGGVDWQNISDRSLPAIGIQSIAVSPENENIIYATTGFSGSYTNNYGIGIIYSNDGGVNWLVDNPPSGYSDLVRTNLLFVSPLAFKAGSNELFVGLDQKVWKKDASINGSGWVSSPIYSLNNQIQNMDQYIHEIDFAPNNENFGIITPTFRKPDEMVYTSDGGLTWNTMPLPTKYTTTTFTKAYTMGTSIPNDNFAFIIVCGYDFSKNTNGEWIPTARSGSIIKYDISSSTPVIIKEWNISDPSLVEGSLSGFSATNLNATQDICFFGKIQNVVYKSNLIFSSPNASFEAISNYSGRAGNGKTHTDIRDLKLVSGKLYAASDGGLSQLWNLTGSFNDWSSLNGNGLAITELSGFDISEFDKNLMVGASVDGNSFKIKSDVNGNIISEHIGSGDQYEVALPKSKSFFDKNITTENGSPNYPPNFEGPGTFGGLQSAFTGSTQNQNKVDFSLKQFYFEDKTNDFYAGTSDVFKINNFLGVYRYKQASEWQAISNTHVNSPFKESTITTKIGISAFKSIKLNDKIFSVYAIRAFSTTSEPVTLVKSTYDPSKTGSAAYVTSNITPYSVTDVDVSENRIYKSYITEIIIDETNPNRIWISFGGTSETSTPSGSVYFTSNGGISWIDVSVGLPGLPVLSMVYWKGTEDIIFAGTDVGVYVFNKHKGVNGEWEGFNNDLPFVCVPKLAINYCSGKLKACTFGRGFWESPLPTLDNTIPITITSNETWNKSMDTYQSVLVKSGTTLTIKGTHNSNNTNSVEIRIPKDKKIIVEAGAKLIIDGATLTNHCDLWQGIEVYGQKNASQDDINQGRIIVKNGAIIENARKGISTSKGTENGWDASSTGAIVECENSSFINNLVDIEILSYHRITSKPLDEKVNKSSISKCKFETSNGYLFGTEKPTHIYLWDVNGVKIVGSHFVDNRTITSGSIGIKSINAGYYVNEYCSGISLPVASGFTCAGIRNVFENLEFGIQSFSQSNPKYSANISNTAFNNCSRSIYLNGIDNASIFLNNFNVKRSASTLVGVYSAERYGIYLDMCKSYKVENNSLVGDVDTEIESSSFGIVVRNMHGENVNINSNAMDKLSVGIEAIGRNRGQTFDKGLQIKCNTFSNSKYDIVVVNDPEIPVGSNVCGIARNQGYPIPNEPNLLAGNLFGNASPYLIKNFVNQGALIDYYHHGPSSNSRVIPSQYFSSSKIVLRDQNIAYSSTTSCPASFTSLLTPAQLRSYVITQEEELVGNLEALAEMIDGGNTDEFLMSLDLNNSSNINANYFLLMNVAPYLSREVLLKVTEDGNALTNAMLRNILVACAQSAKDEEIQNRLDNRSIPLPQYMRDQINQGIMEISDLEDEEREIGSYVTEINHSVNETIWRATQDTLDLSSNIFDIFNEVNDYTLKMQLANWIDADNRRNDANSLIEEIGNNLQTEEDIQNFDIFSNMRNFKYQIEDNNLIADKLDPINIDYLNSFLHYPDVNVSYAMALLKLNNQLNYIEPVLLPQENASRVVNIVPSEMIIELDPSESSLDVSPNPVSDLFTAKYKVLEKSSNLQLVITDINGRELFSQNLKNKIDEIIVNCNRFISGNYIVTLKSDGIKSLSQKIVISKK